MGAKTTISLAEFERLPDDDLKHELDEGDVITMSPTNKRHVKIQRRISRLLESFANARGSGEVYVEASFLLNREPPVVRIPDVCYCAKEPAGPEDEYFHGAPDLAVEVVSPSDSAQQMNRKVRQYLKHGSKAVWIVYPDTREVAVYEPSGTSRILEADQLLEAPGILPGFTVAVSKLFD